jgi:hypothetical protein
MIDGAGLLHFVGDENVLVVEDNRNPDRSSDSYTFYINKLSCLLLGEFWPVIQP